MPADCNYVDSFYTEKIGCRVFKKPFDLKELLKWLDNYRKQIDQKNASYLAGGIEYRYGSKN